MVDGGRFSGSGPSVQWCCNMVGGGRFSGSGPSVRVGGGAIVILRYVTAGLKWPQGIAKVVPLAPESRPNFTILHNRRIILVSQPTTYLSIAPQFNPLLPTYSIIVGVFSETTLYPV
jgi:hypothetical protein